MNKSITVIGAGSWGTALACLLAGNGHKTTLLARDAGKVSKMRGERENAEYLPGVALPEELAITHDIDQCLPTADVIVISVPSSAIRKTMEQIKAYTRGNQIIVSTVKGIEEKSLLRMSEVIAQYTESPVAVLSGPSHAEEVSRNLPATCVVASSDMATADTAQNIFMNKSFRVYTGTDVIGVELGGAFKNVIALAAGINDGLEYGDNSRAALITRGLFEITRLGITMGGSPSTFNGLAGVGDLIVTCNSKHSRNYRMGLLLGKGYSFADALSKIHMVVEGVNTAASVLRLSQNYNVEMPIISEVNKILYEGKAPAQAVDDLMNRDKKIEIY